MHVYLRAKVLVSSIILTSIRQGVILRPPTSKQTSKNPPRLGLMEHFIFCEVWMSIFLKVNSYFKIWLENFRIEFWCMIYQYVENSTPSFLCVLRLPWPKMPGTSFTPIALCIFFSTDAWRPWKHKRFPQRV